MLLGDAPICRDHLDVLVCVDRFLLRCRPIFFIFWGFITSLLDDMHVILGHIPYPPRSAGICLFVHTIVIERMSLLMKFWDFIMF